MTIYLIDYSSVYNPVSGEWLILPADTIAQNDKYQKSFDCGKKRHLAVFFSGCSTWHSYSCLVIQCNNDVLFYNALFLMC